MNEPLFGDQSSSLFYRSIKNSKTSDSNFSDQNGLRFVGKAYNQESGEALPQWTQILFYLQHQKAVFRSFAGVGGSVELELPDLYSSDELFYIASIKGRLIPIEITWEADTKPSVLQNASLSFSQDTDPLALFMKQKNLIDQSYNKPASKKKKTARNFEDIINGADVSFNVEKYITFQTMGELINEVINQSVYYGVKKQKPVVRVKYLKPYLATDDPMYIIDNFMTFNSDFFLSLKPKELKNIKVVRDAVKLKRFGALGKNGIIIVETKEGNVREDNCKSCHHIDGLRKPAFFKPGTSEQNIPQF